MDGVGSNSETTLGNLEIECNDDESKSQRRLRHIASIQVQNLTPFPARDEFASALAQRSTSSQFASPGHHTDDTDIALARRRSRRISNNSITTIRNLRAEGALEDGPIVSDAPPSPNAKRSSSNASTRSGPGAASTSPPARRQVGTLSFSTTPSVRPSRPRAVSRVSITDTTKIFGPPTTSASQTSASTTPSAFSVASNGSSQMDLEKVIWSRLVETFISLSPLPEDADALLPHLEQHSGSTPISNDIPKYFQRRVVSTSSASARRSSLGLSGVPQSPAGGSTPRLTSAMKHAPPPKRDVPPRAPASPRGSAPRASRITPSSSSSSRSSTSTPVSPTKPALPHSRSSTPPLSSTPEVPTPMYISTFHRPSTNPAFTLDAKHEIADWADLSAGRVRVHIWGRCTIDWIERDGKGKGKEIAPSQEPTSGEWKVLHAWDVDLSDLIPLSEDDDSEPSHLQSNTLLITLSPPGRTFYLPSGHQSLIPKPSRPSSPEFNSDPETSLSQSRLEEKVQFLQTRQRAEERGRARKSRTKETGSAGWQDLVKLVTVQACITDTEESLREVLRSSDLALEVDTTGKLRRTLSEREHRIQVLCEQRDAVRGACEQAQNVIQARREELRERQVWLAAARAIHEEDLLSEVDNGSLLGEERKRHTSLANRLSRMRTSLLTTVTAIFPIEPLSPPDLLFTILSVPLPIPMTGTDPAPPLALALHPGVNEDSVATALGYVAHVVQLMARYLSHGLLYPITYIGSRSVIKDPISTMMGPRTFPLYTKGVDTYRFEYAVFLLNKNIEMLMADRNLRALDIRHTLPNLKNLLLTLTDGDTEQVRPPRLFNTLATSPLSRPADQISLDSSKSPPSSPSQTTSELASETSAAGISATTSSTYSMYSVASFARKPKSYLGGLPPLTSMFRSRYPSSNGKPTVKVVVEAPEGNGDHEESLTSPVTARPAESDPEDEDDRRTIRGASASDDGKDKVVNGVAHVGPEEPEKQEGGSPRRAMVAPSAQHVR